MLRNTRRSIRRRARRWPFSAMASGAAAQQTVKIGAVYPLSGNSASAGNYSKMAMEVGADVINNGNAELAKILPLAKGGGLPGLKRRQDPAHLRRQPGHAGGRPEPDAAADQPKRRSPP